MNQLECGRCGPLPAGSPPLTRAPIDARLAQLPRWVHKDGAIAAAFAFGSYADTVALVNGVAAIAQREDHHPDLLVHAKHRIAHCTHSVDGISENDCVRAAKIEALCRI
jgi:4a-hydroxytetrahydrobiopterin dehydratase